MVSPRKPYTNHCPVCGKPIEDRSKTCESHRPQIYKPTAPAIPVRFNSDGSVTNAEPITVEFVNSGTFMFTAPEKEEPCSPSYSSPSWSGSSGTSSTTSDNECICGAPRNPDGTCSDAFPPIPTEKEEPCTSTEPSSPSSLSSLSSGLSSGDDAVEAVRMDELYRAALNAASLVNPSGKEKAVRTWLDTIRAEHAATLRAALSERDERIAELEAENAERKAQFLEAVEVQEKLRIDRDKYLNDGIYEAKQFLEAKRENQLLSADFDAIVGELYARAEAAERVDELAIEKMLFAVLNPIEHSFVGLPNMSEFDDEQVIEQYIDYYHKLRARAATVKP